MMLEKKSLDDKILEMNVAISRKKIVRKYKLLKLDNDK